MANETTTVIKKIVPYLTRRGYSLDDNLFFGERAENEQIKAGFIDILVKRSARATKALFLIEAKRDNSKLSLIHRDQALKYGKTIAVPFVVTTNSVEFELFNTHTEKKLKINGSVIGKIPHYTMLENVLSQFKINPYLDSISLVDDESLPFRPGLNLVQLHALIRRCHNTIRDVEKDEENIFADFSKLLFLKLLEEKQDRGELGFILPYTYRFHELARLGTTPDQARDAIQSMMHQVVSIERYGDVMTPTLDMEKPITYLKVVKELSKANFTDSELDVRGSVFEYFVRTSLKGKKLGQFFTPRPLVRFMLSLVPIDQIIADLLDPESKVTVVDPACGSGGFLLAGMNYLLKKVDEGHGSLYNTERANKLKQRIKQDVFWGVEANQRIASAAKMNMIIAGDGFANIKQGDSLKEDISFLQIANDKEPFADFVLTNPPFGMSEAESLTEDDFEIYALKLAKTQPLFLQKFVRITKPKGRICTVIDEGVLNTSAMTRIRKYLMSNCHVDAVIRLPDVTFQPNKINVRSSVLVLTRKQDEDEQQPYPVRMIEMYRLGYDSMGEEDTDLTIEQIISLVKSRWDDIGRIELTLDDTGGVFRSYPLQLNDILTENEVRLDFKYYDPDTLRQLEILKGAGAKPLSELTIETLHRGKSPAKAQYNSDPISDVIVVKAGNIGRKDLVPIFDTIPDNIYALLETAQLKDGDLLLASTGEGTLGKVAVFRLKKRAVADGHVTIIRLNDEIQADYAAWYLRSKYGWLQMNRLFTGSTGLIELPENEVKKILILVPTDKSKQTKLAKDWLDSVHQAEKLEHDAKSKREQAKYTFEKSLLHVVCK